MADRDAVSDETAAVPDETTAKERSVARSLDPARVRAGERYDRIIATTWALIRRTGSIDFTLHDVAIGARMSLRTFYKHFSGRDDLLFAVWEDGITTSLPRLRTAMEQHDDPLDALHAFVETIFRLVFDDDHPENRPLVGYHMHLAQTNPSALAGALAPRDALLRDVLARGVERGVFRDDIAVDSLATLLSQTLIALMHNNVLGTHAVGAPLDRDTVWAFCMGAVRS
jgi:AcrR family transcriptional regulator